MAKTENGRPSVDMGSIRTLNSSHMEDESSLGSDSEINGFTSERQADRYGFIGGAQQYSEESAQDVPPEVLRQREVKWLDMLSHWDKWMIKRFNKVRLRCQKGIPPALRGRAWLYLSGGKVKREQNQGKFQELDSQPGDPKWLDVIEKDLHRQFPFHEMFVSRGGHGQQDLFRVLKAYTLYRPDEGYCQAQAPIAAVLLMHMPAEDAFWGLVQICEKYLPGYYSPGLEAIQLDGEILFALLRRVSPLAFRHLEKHKIDPVLYMTEWFMCAFSRTLPWASVLRVWDMFLCDGVKIIFRVGLVLLKCTLGTREKLKTCQGLYETMELLRAIDPRYMQEGFLVREILEVPVTARDIDREHHTQIKRWKKNRGELNFRPAPRMHGARIIMQAEPPRRQDLQQNPTIVLEVPEPPQKLNKGKEERKSKKKKSMKKPTAIEEIPNPYPLPTDTPPQSLNPPPPSLNPPPQSLNLPPPSLNPAPPSLNPPPPSLNPAPPSLNPPPPSLNPAPPSLNPPPPSLNPAPPSLNPPPPSLNPAPPSLNPLPPSLNPPSPSLATPPPSFEPPSPFSDLPPPSLAPPPPSSDLPSPPPYATETPETSPETEINSNHQQSAPPTDLPAAKESALQQSTQSLSSSEQDTYL